MDRPSEWSDWLSAITGAFYITNSDFADGVYSLFREQGLYAIRDVTELPVDGDFTGEKVFNRTDGQLYQWTGTAWEAITADLRIPDGSITATQIADDAITTPKLAAGAVSADKIAANTITGNKIAANTITGGLIAASGIITNSAQINDLIVGRVQLGLGSVTDYDVSIYSLNQTIAPYSTWVQASQVHEVTLPGAAARRRFVATFADDIQQLWDEATSEEGDAE